MSIKDELQRLTGVHGHSINDVLDSTNSMGGGSDIFIIKVWGPGTSNLQKDKTFEEMLTAVTSGKPCFVGYVMNKETWDPSDGVTWYSLVTTNISQGASTKALAFIKVTTSKLVGRPYAYYYTLKFTPDEAIAYEAVSVPIGVTLPARSGTEGQILRANATGDKLQWADYPTYSLSISDNVITLTGSDGTTSSITLPS